MFAPLKAHLLQSELPSGHVEKWMASGHLKFEARRLTLLLKTPEHKLNYAQFLGKRTVSRSRSFMRKHKQHLTRAWRKHGVAPEVIVAILAVETNLGSYQGKHLVFNILASQAVLDTDLGQAKLKRAWPAGKRGVFKQDKFKRRLAKRAAWAREELIALGRLALKRNVSPYSYKGSLAGAMGICQFVPTSLERWGADGNQDGRIQLHHPHDAIFSVARYLESHGWQDNLSAQDKARVLYTYNRSHIYGRTVLALAQRIK